MRIYAILEDVGSEYYTIAPVKISLTPFNGDCYFIDLEEGQTYETISVECDESDWRPYNGVVNLGTYFCNPDTGEYINSRIVVWSFDKIELENGEIINPKDPKYDNWESDWQLFQKYENGLPIGKPYFEFDE